MTQLRNVDSCQKNKEDLVVHAPPQIAVDSEAYEAMESVQRELVKLGEEFASPAVLPQLAHVFAGGMYSRIGELQAGTVVVGDIHKYEHFFVLLSGRLHLADGNTKEFLEAPAIRIASAGTKRALLAVTDCMIATFHAGVTEAEKDSLVCHSIEEYKSWLASRS